MSEVKQEPDSIRSRIVILVGTGALIAFGIGIGWAAWIQKDDTGSLLDADELVVLTVGLETDLLARTQRHEDELRVRAGEEDPPEVVVRDRVAFDVGDVAVHVRLLGR